MNLTAIRTVEEAVRRHYGESIVLAQELPAGSWRLLDVGSGAGFPGIPVAVLRPECEVVLLESDVRKAIFLEEAACGLPNCRVLNERLDRIRDQFDWITSRAVRWKDLARSMGTVADKAALLVSESQVEALRSEVNVTIDRVLRLSVSAGSALLFMHHNR